MSEQNSREKRLSRNFHKSFKPERQYLAAMMRYAASGYSGDYQEIAAETGIPMGESSGKVPAILDYCRGMGLIRLHQNSNRSKIKYPELTPFGRIVLLEDPFLKLPLTQWIAHFNLCNPLTGADVWYHTFFAGAKILKDSFKREDLDSYLSVVYSSLNKGIIGPLISMYADASAFNQCSVLIEDCGNIVRKEAPIKDDFGWAYGAWLIQIISDHFPRQQQVSISELESKAGLKTIPGWSVKSLINVLITLERKALIVVDRHMEPWLIQPKKSINEVWSSIYLDII